MKMNKRWKIMFWSIFLLTLGPIAGMVIGHFVKNLFSIGLDALIINIIPIGFLLGLMLFYLLSRLLECNLFVSIFLLIIGSIIGVIGGYFTKSLFSIGLDAMTINTIPIGFLLGLIWSYLLFRFLKWNWWAPNNFCYTFVGEGRAKIIVKGRAYNRTFLQWTGYKISQSGKVERTSKKSKKSDIHFYGFWPVKDVYGYSFSWTDEKKVHTPRVIDYVLVKPAIYIISVEKAEDANNIPLEIDFACQIKVINPYDAIFSIQGWLQAVTAHIKAKTREVVATESFEDLYKIKEGESDDIKSKVKDLENTLKKDDYYKKIGIVLESIKIKNINPTLQEHRTAFSAKRSAELKAKAIEVEAEAERKRIELIASSFLKDEVKLMRFLEALQKGNSNYVLPSDISKMVEKFFK